MRFRFIAVAVLLAAPVVAATGLFTLPRYALPASAAPATGAVTGQVVWNAPLPVPYGAPGFAVPGQPEAPIVPGGTAEPGTGTTPGASPDAAAPVAPEEAVPSSGAAPRTAIPIRPPQPRVIPAGAVLVAVQGTSLSARTDDSGSFRIDGVPVGQYLTVAAGPVRGVSTAVVSQPNVFLQNGGQTVDLGRMYLGQIYSYGPIPYGATVPAPDAAPAGSDATQPELQAPSDGSGQ